jgi:hypothetical protein
MIKMRKLTVKANSVEVHVGSWDTYLNDKSLRDIISENLEGGIFRAKVAIMIEEIESDLVIEGNKPEPEPEPPMDDEEEFELTEEEE